jgi:hypothetical protein
LLPFGVFEAIRNQLIGFTGIPLFPFLRNLRFCSLWLLPGRSSERPILPWDCRNLRVFPSKAPFRIVRGDFSPLRLSRIASLEFFPLQHISAFKSTVGLLRPIAGIDRLPALPLPSSGFLFTLLTVYSMPLKAYAVVFHTTSALEVSASAFRSLG